MSGTNVNATTTNENSPSMLFSYTGLAAVGCVGALTGVASGLWFIKGVQPPPPIRRLASNAAGSGLSAWFTTSMFVPEKFGPMPALTTGLFFTAHATGYNLVGYLKGQRYVRQLQDIIDRAEERERQKLQIV